MKEKVLSKKKNGMAALFGILASWQCMQHRWQGLHLARGIHLAE